MSRRESRVSMNVRQNDALFEFENFKKKFLLANKHITKLNSTLSVRIEELNAQISSLYVENLRLRASEIALAAQLKREREKSRKVMTEAETATLNLTKHLSYLRQSFNISTSSPAPSTPPSPRARKPPPNRNPANPANPASNSPQVPRLSRAPNVPGIGEEDEPLPSSSEDEDTKPPSPVVRKTSKSKPRLSASRLPLPARIPEPSPLLPLAGYTIPSELQQSGSSTRPRKPTRRQSGLLSINDSLSVPRAASPAFGSPIRRAAGLAEEAEEAAIMNEQLRPVEADMDVELEEEIHPKKIRRKSKGKEREVEGDKEKEGEGAERLQHPPPRERERERDKKKTKGEDDVNGKGKPRLKDVTNSRAALLPIDNTVYDQPDQAVAVPTRQFLGTSPPPSQPTSLSSSSPLPPSDGEGGGGRERRTRKSVNYAEPKLNTKMRKPDPPPGMALLSTKKRSSAAAVLTTYRPHLPEDATDDADNDNDNDIEGARSSLELPLPFRVNGNTIDPALFPLPQSRPSSAAGTSAGPVLFSPPVARTSVKRKKSRPQIVLDDDGEESEGVQADAEYGYGQGAGWVNVEGRRRGGGSGNGSGSGAKRSTAGVIDEARRHSMAV